MCTKGHRNSSRAARVGEGKSEKVKQRAVAASVTVPAVHEHFVENKRDGMNS